MKKKKGGKHRKHTVTRNEAGKQTFEKLKEQLTMTPVLAYPTTIDEFILDTDTRYSDIGGILSDIQNVEEIVIVYTLRISPMRSLNIV